MNKWLRKLGIAYLWLSVAFLAVAGAHFLNEALFMKTQSISGTIVDVQAHTQGFSRGWRRTLSIRLAGDTAYYRLPRFFITTPPEDTLRRAKHASMMVDVDASTLQPGITQQPLRPKVTHSPDRRFHIEYQRKSDAPVLSYDITAITLDGTPYLTPRSYCYEMLGRAVVLWAIAGMVAWPLLLPSMSNR